MERNPMSMDSKINIVKMAVSILSTALQAQCNLSKLQLPFYRNRQANSKIPVPLRGNQNSQNNLEKNRTELEDSYLNFENYSKATVIKIV